MTSNVRLLMIQNCDTEGFGQYKTYLEERSVAITILQAYRGFDVPSMSGFDGVIIGGTPISAYENEAHKFLRDECEFLKTVLNDNKPCLGICCGAQLLAMILGAQVKRNPIREIGTYDVTLTDDGRNDGILEGFPEIFPVFHWHGDTFEIPVGAKLLVRGEACQNQMFRYENIIGLQFHIEIDADEARRWAGVYTSELKTFGKSSSQVYEECHKHEAEMQSLAERLIQNFLDIITSSRPT